MRVRMYIDLVSDHHFLPVLPCVSYANLVAYMVQYPICLVEEIF